MNRKLFLCLLFLMFPFQLNGSSLTVPAKPRKTDNPAVFDNGLIVNEESSDSDSRFESNDVTDMLLLDAGVNAIGINATPTSGNNATLIVESTSTTAAHDAFRVNNNAGTSLFVVEEDGHVGVAKADPSVELDITGALTVSAASTFNGDETHGDASGDVNTVNSASWTYVNDVNISANGGPNGFNIGVAGTFTALSVDSTNKRTSVGMLSGNMADNTNFQVYDGDSFSRLQVHNADIGQASGDGVELAMSGTSARVLSRENDNFYIGTNASTTQLVMIGADRNSFGDDAPLNVLGVRARTSDSQTNYVLLVSSTNDSTMWGVTHNGGMWLVTQTSTPTAPTSAAGLATITTADVAELKAIDGSGNVTLLSPHSNGKWIFDSENMFTGRRLLIDTERMARTVEAIGKRIGLNVDGMITTSYDGINVSTQTDADRLAVEMPLLKSELAKLREEIKSKTEVAVLTENWNRFMNNEKQMTKTEIDELVNDVSVRTHEDGTQVIKTLFKNRN